MAFSLSKQMLLTAKVEQAVQAVHLVITFLNSFSLS